MDVPEGIQLISLLILVILSGFFSSAETAFSTVNRVRMRTLEEEGSKRAAKVNKILESYSKMLSTVLIGNNIVNLSTSALTTTIALRFGIPVAVATGVLTLVILLCGEIVPKTWAMLSSDKIALAYCGIIYGLMQVMTPVIFVVDKMSNGILRLLHIDPSKKITTMTEAELRTYVDVSHESGVIESEEKEMIYNVFDFSDALAKDIMVPRINMVTVDVEATFEEVLSIFRESMYTRFPVYQDDKDNIIGLINIKDFILTEDEEHFQVRSILRDAHYTYEYKKVADLLYELREKTTSVTFVLNEYGATVGMITLEDLLEEIVGEIRDEYDEDEEEYIQKVDERVYLVEGSMKLDDINDELDTELDSEDYDSIGGIIIESLDRLPEDGEEVTLENGIHLKVQGIEQNRIVKVLMTIPEKTEDEEENDGDREQSED
ncbi:HlyC/CorC family transporter [uncultured Acetatifactor sp.]|uniref:HlyC/CorC family transporter n=1 Tax=uncultured Acetatifactor sp. TaxID=1671927 RepID=UPI00260B1EFC|nr:hemolysin family protein [uncultured Acetatifactor sp.]MCI8696465.1 HlyC/CorC family transporter [Lachnospiraceae bacterium]MCI9651240.1 HlyC/CorC family transporter [Lachnospiraceae bacterium]